MNRYKILKAIGSRIRQVRKTLKYSQEKMAPYFGVARPSYNKYEHGEVFPGPSALTMLAEKFNISLDWLIANRGLMYYNDSKEEQPEEKTEPESQNIGDDVQDLLAHIQRIPLLRYEVLIFFHKFKLKHKNLVESSLNMNMKNTDTEEEKE